MQVFLTGASGYIGSAVADRLRAAGHVVSGLARSDTAASRLPAAGIQPTRGNFTEPKRVGAAARSGVGVISMATTYDPNVDGPAIGAMLAALAGSNKPMIYASGIWSHGDAAGKVVDETSPPRPATLVQWRQAVEERVLDAAREGIRTVVIRPAIVYGRGRGIPAEFLDSARKEGGARFVGTGQNRWPFVYVDDLADLYLLALERAPAGTLLLAVGGPSYPVKDVAAAASRGVGAGDVRLRGRSRRPGRCLGPTPMRWCSISRLQVSEPRSSSAGAPAGPMPARTSSMDHISRRDRQVRQAAGQDGLGGSAFQLGPRRRRAR